MSFPRQRVAELMDDPALDAAEHRRALAGLHRINRLSGAVAALWRHVRAFAATAGRPIRLLDVAAGGGETAIGLARRAERAGLAVSVQGCDISPVAVAAASERARRAGVAVEFFRLDVLQDAWPGRWDVVTCSLFLHHLDESDAVRLLGRMAEAAAGLVLVNDLRRCWMGLMAAYVVPRVLTRSGVVHVDAVRSVQAAFTPVELLALAERAGWRGARCETHFPWRQMLMLRK